METFKINGQSASAEDFVSVLVLVDRLQGETQKYVAKASIEKDEILNCLDQDKNGNLDFNELCKARRKLGSGDFFAASASLHRHKFNLYAETTDLSTIFNRFLAGASPALSEKCRSFWHDSEFVLAAIQFNVSLLRFASPTLRNNKLIVLTAVARDYSALYYADPKLKKSQKFAQMLVDTQPLSYCYFDHRIRADKKILMQALALDDAPFSHAPDSLKKDPDILRQLTTNPDTSLRYVPDSERKKIEVVLPALANDIHNLRYCDKNTRHHPLVMALTLKLDPLALLYLDEKLITEELFRHNLAVHKITVPQILSGMPFQKILRLIHKITRFPARFASLQDLLNLAAVRFELNQGLVTNKAIALLLYNTADANGAFDYPKVVSAFAQNKNFISLYYEIQEDRDIENILSAVKRKTGKPIHTLVIAGHGSRHEILLGPGKAKDESTETLPRDKNKLQSSDFSRHSFKNMRHHLTPDAQILLYACSTGEGGALARNLPNTMARQLHVKTSIHSAETSTNVDRIEIDPLTLRFKIEWNGSRDYVTQGHMSRQ